MIVTTILPTYDWLEVNHYFVVKNNSERHPNVMLFIKVLLRTALKFYEMMPSLPIEYYMCDDLTEPKLSSTLRSHVELFNLVATRDALSSSPFPVF